MKPEFLTTGLRISNNRFEENYGSLSFVGLKDFLNSRKVIFT
jgi:hypothetical protein